MDWNSLSSLNNNNDGIAKLTSAITDILLPLQPGVQNNENCRKFNLAKDLQFFNKDLENWSNFIVQYKKSTELCRLTDKENFIRLEKCPEGKSREV